MKKAPSFDQFNLGDDVSEGLRGMEKTVEEILDDAGFVKGEEFRINSKLNVIKCTSAKTADLVCKALQADDIECHVKDSDVIVESSSVGESILRRGDGRPPSKRERIRHFLSKLGDAVDELGKALSEEGPQDGPLAEEIDAAFRRFYLSYTALSKAVKSA